MRLGVVTRASLLVCLLAAPVTLTALRLAQPLDTTAVQLVGLAPWAMPLYLIVALVAMAPTVRHRARTFYVMPAVLAVIGFALHAVWFAPQVTGEVRAPAEGAPRITVMASNIQRGQGDAAALLGAAAEHDVDVLVVEEITPEALAAMRRAGLRERYPYAAGQPAPGAPGTMVFSRIRLSEPERLATGFGTWRMRVGGGLTLIAVHMTAPADPQRWRTDFEEVLAAVRAQPPDLVVGDFNATADHGPMRDLLAEGFRDGAELDNHWRPTWPANHRGDGVARFLPPVAPIDHVLVGSRMAALDSATVRVADTDHLAVVAQVARSAGAA